MLASSLQMSWSDTMRGLVSAILASLPLAPALFSQAATRVQVNSGMDTERTRQLDSLSEPDQPSAKVLSPRSLSSEEADDPTISSAPVDHHDPPAAARKAAQKAEHLSKKGHHEEAIAELRNAVAIDPQYYEAENNLAMELEAAGKTEDAEKTLRRLTQAAPQHVLAFSNLATLLCRQQRYAEAETVARQALKLHKFSFKTNYLLGIALVDQGNWTDEAKAKLEYAQVKYLEAKALLDKWPAAPQSISH